MRESGVATAVVVAVASGPVKVARLYGILIVAEITLLAERLGTLPDASSLACLRTEGSQDIRRAVIPRGLIRRREVRVGRSGRREHVQADSLDGFRLQSQFDPFPIHVERMAEERAVPRFPMRDGQL